MKAAATVAGIAGVPVDPDSILDWICGRTPPPRHSEGLNDPLSVAAIMHFLLLGEDGPDSLARASLNTLRTLLDDRTQAEMWGRDDLVRFGRAFREARARLGAPYPSPTLLAVAERLQAIHRELEINPTEGRRVTTIDGRLLNVDPRSFGIVWLLACMLPKALAAAGVTIQQIPSLVWLPKFLTGSAAELAGEIETALGRTAWSGLAELDKLERAVAALSSDLGVTRRSKLPTLIRLELAYPGLRVPAIARLLDISPQGAAKLAAQAKLAAA
ncbi:hypothetical protein [Sphingopyxis terrae]|uniref:hypothetical protein n=1 Tax=Sphingopyxis terrae TaxID=33052 RepID=UPI0020D23E2C|nr:hypothetical protein [Sphingopyxis terrae]